MFHLKRYLRNSLELVQGEQREFCPCGTHFGGFPDVPSDFVWPTFTGKSRRGDGSVAERPLAFLFQLNCAELDGVELDHTLPHSGLLSFFYDMETEPHGYELGECGASRAYWFPDASDLQTAEPPLDLPAKFQFPCISFAIKPGKSLPGYEDYILGKGTPDWTLCDKYDAEKELLGCPERVHCCRMLGWPDAVQGTVLRDAELIYNGYHVDEFPGLSLEKRRELERSALDRWELLLQLDWLRSGDFTFMIGDAGRLYFMVPRTDLAERRFDRLYVGMQCS